MKRFEESAEEEKELISIGLEVMLLKFLSKLDNYIEKESRRRGYRGIADPQKTYEDGISKIIGKYGTAKLQRALDYCRMSLSNK